MGREQMLVIGGILGSLFLIVIGAVLYNQFKFGDPAHAINSGKFIHWHAEMTAIVCGQEQQMPRAAAGGEVGSGPIHTHDDGRVHMEGSFKNESELAVKRYLLSVGIPFSDKGIFNKADGSPCTAANAEATSSAQPEASGRLHGTVQGKNDQAPHEVPDILNYSMRDGDKIRLIYE